MTVDYRALNAVTPPLHAAVLDTILIIENIQKHLGQWYVVLDLANAFFTIPNNSDQWKYFAFTWQGRQYTFTRLPQGYKHSPNLCHKIVAKHLDEWHFPNIEIYHYIDDIMLQGHDSHSMQQAVETLITPLQGKGWKINPAKVQGPAQHVKFLGIMWDCGNRSITPKAKQRILEFPTPTTKKEAQKYIGLFGYWRNHIPHLSLLLQPLYKVTRKKYTFEWGPDQQQAFDKAKEAVQQACEGGANRIDG